MSYIYPHDICALLACCAVWNPYRAQISCTPWQKAEIMHIFTSLPLWSAQIRLMVDMCNPVTHKKNVLQAWLIMFLSFVKFCILNLRVICSHADLFFTTVYCYITTIVQGVAVSLYKLAAFVAMLEGWCNFRQGTCGQKCLIFVIGVSTTFGDSTTDGDIHNLWAHTSEIDTFFKFLCFVFINI